jgi:DNA primase
LVLALDADSAGVRAGLRSAQMALRAGFDVKVPAFPEGKDPADIARENPELLKAAIRTSRTAVEFFLDVLRPTARDERSYKKVVETNILPLIAAIDSKIDQEHFIRIVAGRIGVSEAAVAAEVARKPKLNVERKEEETKVVDIRIEQTPLERAVAMLTVRLVEATPAHERLLAVVGAARIKETIEKNKDDEERLRFEFDLLGEDEVAVTEGLLQAIERKIIQEKIATLQNTLRMGSGAEHSALLREITTLKRREEELRKRRGLKLLSQKFRQNSPRSRRTLTARQRL